MLFSHMLRKSKYWDFSSEDRKIKNAAELFLVLGGAPISRRAAESVCHIVNFKSLIFRLKAFLHLKISFHPFRLKR